jgi:hypothetical protein
MMGMYPSITFWKDRALVFFVAGNREGSRVDAGGKRVRNRPNVAPAVTCYVCVGLPISWFEG